MTFVFTTLICLFGIFDYSIFIYRNKDKYILSVGCENFDSLDEAVKEAKRRNLYNKVTHEVLKALLISHQT